MAQDVGALQDGRAGRRERTTDDQARWGAAPTLAHLLSLAIAAPVVLFFSRKLWFFGDEWEFIVRRGFRGARDGLFIPHNEHWSTLPILVWRTVEALVGLHSYRPYLAALVATHLLLAHLLWRLMRRCGADCWISTGLVATFAVLGAGAENIVWAFQIGFVGAVTFGVAALLVAEGVGPGKGVLRLAVGWAAQVAALMCSGVGLTMVAVAILVAQFRRGPRAALLTGSIPVAVYLSWFVWLGRGHSGAPPTPNGLYLEVGNYVWTGLRNAVDSASGMPGAGAVLLLGLVIALLRGWRESRDAFAVPSALALGAIVFFTLAGISRISFGVDQAQQLRYVYTAISLLLVPSALALSRLAGGSRSVQLTILALIGLAGLQNIAAFATFSTQRAAVVNRQREIIVAAARLAATGRVLAADSAQPLPLVDPDLHLGDLRHLIADGQFDPAGGPTPSRGPFLDAAAQLDVVVVADSAHAHLSDSVGFEGAAGASAGPIVDHCVTVTSADPGSRVRLSFGDDATVRIVPSTGGSLTVFLTTSDDPNTVAPPAVHRVDAHQPLLLRIAVPRADPLVALPLGETSICGIAA